MYKIDNWVLKYRSFFYPFACILILCVLIPIVAIFFSTIYYSTQYKQAMVVEVEQTTYEDENGKMISVNHYQYEIDNQTYYCQKKIEDGDTDYDYTEDLVYYSISNPKECFVNHDGETSTVAFVVNDIISMIFCLLFVLIVLLSAAQMVRGYIVNIRLLKKIKQLQKTGKLVKNIPCTLKNNGKKGMSSEKILVSYVLPSKEEKQLCSERIEDFHARSEYNQFRGCKKIDLLIDEEHPDIYYMDFKIDRMDGNREEDYYQEKEFAKK